MCGTYARRVNSLRHANAFRISHQTRILHRVEERLTIVRRVGLTFLEQIAEGVRQ